MYVYTYIYIYIHVYIYIYIQLIYTLSIMNNGAPAARSEPLGGAPADRRGDPIWAWIVPSLISCTIS